MKFRHHIAADEFRAGAGPGYAGASNQRFLAPIVKCANPFCDSIVPVRGEHCQPCRSVQAREVARLRATKSKER